VRLKYLLVEYLVIQMNKEPLYSEIDFKLPVTILVHEKDWVVRLGSLDVHPLDLDKFARESVEARVRFYKEYNI